MAFEFESGSESYGIAVYAVVNGCERKVGESYKFGTCDSVYRIPFVLVGCLFSVAFGFLPLIAKEGIS